ncbi:phosphate ABC transporter permease PstA [uncultured Tyzzerella sp.]|uniref:phosphate ABC transporter permease PstA n=1 Tax=uncultured Tyzzerella sp. TaxID=2321398 RepID=UPI002943086D|nr:phosphate ABC transporter permease PstA [uncultured Tyzzerella sp.]
MENSIYNKKNRPLDSFLLALIYLSMIITVFILVSIIGYVAYRGISKVNWEFISTVPSTVNETFGILGNIINTLYIIFITLLISLPIGIGAAIYLNEYAKNAKFVRVIEFTTETLAGIPSIIYGLFGMVFFGITLNLKFSILCGSLTLTIMILPLIIRTTTESLRTVPKGYRDGAIGMGSTKWYMIRTIILPSAAPGIVTGTILAIGRIIGESAALLFTAGSVYLLPKNLFTHIFNSGGTLTIQMYLSMSKAEYDNAFGIGFVLLCLVFLLNMITKLILSKSKK